MLGVYTFIADHSPPKYRTFRLIVMNVFRGVAMPLGTQLGSFLFSSGGYVCVYGTQLLLTVIGVAMGFARIWGFEENVTKRRKEKVENGEKIVSN